MRLTKVDYRKRRSRDVTLKGNACLKRLRGEAGEKTDTVLKEAFDEHSSKEDDDDKIFIIKIKFRETTESNEDEKVLEKLLTLQPNHRQPQEKCDYTKIRSKVLFTHQEDQYLAQGLKNYGLGEWFKGRIIFSVCVCGGRGGDVIFLQIKCKKISPPPCRIHLKNCPPL